jgi:hypothetical protein
VSQGGVFKSTDSGLSWGAPAAPCAWERCGRVEPLAIDPFTPGMLYVAGKGVFKSTDGGLSWSATGLRGWAGSWFGSLAIDPFTPGTLYAAGRGVYKSTDGGAIWHAVLGWNSRDSVPGALAIHPFASGTLYASRGPDGYPGVFKSTDGGETWRNTGLAIDRVTRIRAIAIDPAAPETLDVGSAAGVSKSTAGGGTWFAIDTGLTITTNTGLVSAEVQALVIDPTRPTRLYAGTVGGGVFWIDQVSACVGDCKGGGQVTVDELLTMVDIALHASSASECTLGDTNHDNHVTIDEILTAVNVALNGCIGQGRRTSVGHESPRRAMRAKGGFRR